MHNTNAETNQNILKLSNNLKEMSTQTNERVSRNVQQIDYNNNYTTSTLNEKINIVDKKVLNVENTVQEFGVNLVKIDELNNANVLSLSKQSITLSQQALEDIAEASSTTLGLAKLWEVMKGYIENKAGEEVQKPRVMSINILNIIKKDAVEEE